MDLKIAILDDYAGVSTTYADWRALGEVTVFDRPFSDGENLSERLASYDVICLMRERTTFPRALIDSLPRLKLIVTSGLRNAAIDIGAATERGIPVCGTQSMKTTTAELTLALILNLNRRIVPEAAALASGGWQGTLGRDLYGLRLGLIGLGNIGAQVARLGRAFGMEVSAWSPNLTEERCAEVGADRCATLPALMSSCDVTSVHLVLSARSRNTVGREAFEAAKPDAVFVNTSRAGLVDTQALLDGLHAGRPSRAGIDVFDQEPLPPEHPLLDKALIADGRLLLTPHLGYATEANFRQFYTQMVECIAGWKNGTPVRVIAA